MNDEIKVILEHLKQEVNDGFWFETPNESAKILLYYITNLQTIEQEYSAILSENAELENKITNLQEKYERMKENAEILSNGYNELEKRIDKAVVIIQNDTTLNPQRQRERLLNTLTGGDE